MIADQIAGLDLSLFAHVESDTSDDDRKSLLAVHHAIASQYASFSFLEIGSHLGGTLQAVLADPRCRQIVSIDPRPASQPDDRPGRDHFEYPDNSTDRMLTMLKAVPEADFSKLETVEASTENLAPGRFERPDFCFIDGEHTYSAALRDARFCRTVMQGAGIIAFHDRWIIEPAICDFLRETPRPHRAYWLRSEVFVVELGIVTVLSNPIVQSRLYRSRRGWLAVNRIAADRLLMIANGRRRQIRQTGS